MDWTAASISLLTYLAFCAIAIVLFGSRLERARIRLRRSVLALSSKDLFDCGIRVAQGQVPGLGSRWKNGAGHFEQPGQLVWGRRKTRVGFTSLDTSHPRKPYGREILRISPATVIVRATESSGATLEIAVLPDRLPFLESRIPRSI